MGRGGSALDPEVVSRLLRRSRRDDPVADLTAREREVLELMAEGRSNAAIAEQMVVTERAVEKHVTSIFGKLGPDARPPRTTAGCSPCLPSSTVMNSGRYRSSTAVDLRRRYGEGGAAVDALDGRDRVLRPRPLRGDHGPVGLGQVHPDAHPRRPRPAHLGHGGARRHRPRRPRRLRPHRAAPRQARLHLPVLQPAAGAHGGGEHHPAAHDRRAQARPGVAGAGDRGGGPGRPAHAPPGGAVRRPAAAGGGGAGAGVQARRGVRRRAHRQPRLDGLGRGAGAAAPGRRRLRPDRGDGHPRGACRRATPTG